MGTSFSALDKHGGCYNFGVNLGSKTPSRRNPNQWFSSTVLPSSVQSACNTCRILAPGAVSSGCGRGLQPADPSCSGPHCPFGVSSWLHADPLLLSGNSNQSQQTISSLHSASVPSSDQASTRTPRRTSTTQPRITLSSQTGTTLEDTVIVREPALRSFDDVDQSRLGENRRTTTAGSGTVPVRKQRTMQNRKLMHYLYRKTDVKEATWVYVSHFSTLLQLWSFDELYQLQNQFEALELLKGITVAANEARSKAPTLDEDLRALCSSGWCNNMQVSYGHVVRGAHSYILSARSHVFSKVLHAVYRSLFNKSRNTSLLPIMSILVPNLDDENYLLDTSHSNATPDPFRNSPDVLRSTSMDPCQQCVRCQEPRLRGDRTLSTQSSVEPQLGQRSRRDHKSSQSVLFEHAVFDFLIDLYAGHNRNSFNLFLEEPNHRHYSPTKPKPDLLCLPEAPARLHSANSGSDLLCLYRVIDSTHPESPLAPDCRLTFSCEHSPPCYEMLHVKCHAGLLAARSQFLRRLLLRRYVAQVGEGGDLTSVVFDGRLIKPYFAHLLVQFFYSDRLDLNAIAAMAQPRKTHGSTAVNCGGSRSEHSCRLVSESAHMQHTEWHSTHTGVCGTKARKLPCCVGYLEDDASYPTVDPYNQTASNISGHGGCLASPHVSAQQHIKFCLSCPYCLACVLELHPVGQYLEFPRLTEACEDLVVKALRLPVQNSVKDPDLPSDFSDQGSHGRTRYIRVTPISLAVGLLRWADCAFTRPSPTSSSVESVVIQQNSADTRQERSSSVNTNEPRLPATDMSMKSSDLFRSPETQSDDRSTTTRYLYLQAVQCLRDNFMFLVRTPQVLGRLTPKQFREVLDSSLVQAPESEVLAALLCWSEQRIRYAQDKGTPDGSRLSAYTSLVSIISEQPDRAYCSRSLEINPWLLLGLNQSDEYSRSIELAAQDLPLRQTSSAECDLCHAMDERNNQSQNIIGFDPVDLEVLVKKLHQHRLLETLRPTHLLTPVPLGLATVILQYHLGVTKKSSLSSESLLASSAQLANNSPLLGLDAVDPIQFYHWAPLLTTSMMLLRHSSSTTEQPTTSLHPILSLKLGNGPLSVLPPSSPAQVSPRNAWLSVPQSVNHVVSLRRFRVPCYCRWAANADPKDNVKGSGSDSNSPKPTSNPQPDRSPRLFYPFFNEVRVILTSRSLSSTPVRNPPVGHESRCTCLRLLSTLSAQCTPTHVPLTAIQRNDSFPVPIGYNQQQPVSTCEAAITVSPQKGDHADTASVTTTREPCCSSKCADFAHCLLQPHQWTDLISRYLQLVEEFVSRHSNPWLRLDANHVCLLYRLQVLREQGLPDDLHTLLACRINERLCELSQDVADLSSEVAVDRQTLDIISSTVSASKHAGVDLSHFSIRSYEPADASSFSVAPEKETSPVIPEEAASVSVTAREKHSRRVNASLHPYIETKNEPMESHKCLACQTAGQPVTLLDYPAGSRHPFPKPRSSPSARITQPNTTSHGVRKNSNTTLPCLCDNLPYPTYTLPGFDGKQRRINKYPDDNLCSIPRSIHRSRRQKLITKPSSTSPLLLVPLGRTQQGLRGSANPKHELVNRKQKARYIRGVSFEDVPAPRCSCPHFLPTETKQNLSFKRYPGVCSTEFRRECSRFYPEPHYFTMLYCHSNNRRSPLPPTGFPSHLSSSCSYRSSSDFSEIFSKSISDLSDTLSLGDYSITLDATD